MINSLLRSKVKEAALERSEGEEFLEVFFYEFRIDYEAEKTIKKLLNDDKAHRVADFYLPAYGVYVEFFGLWNKSKDDRLRYQEKMKIYSQNRIPCVYIYPENLGVIEYCFDRRIQKELEKHNLKAALQKYQLHKFWRNYKWNIFWGSVALFTFIAALIYQFAENDGLIIGIAIATIIYHFYTLFRGYRDIFIYQKHPMRL